jgi:hypothetical protein
MDLEIGGRMHLVDIDENTPISLQQNNYKHNILVHVSITYSTGHKFDNFTIIPKYHLYS